MQRVTHAEDQLAVWISLFGRDIRGVEGGGWREDDGDEHGGEREDSQRDVGWATSAIVVSGNRHDYYVSSSIICYLCLL
jgi:hypothetical protein